MRLPLQRTIRTFCKQAAPAIKREAEEDWGQDSSGQKLAYVYYEEEPDRRC